MRQVHNKENMETVAPMLRCSEVLTCPTAAAAKKEGCVYLLQGCRKLRVRLSIHHSHFGRFAIVSQDKLLCQGSVYVNLRNCTFRKSSNGRGFQILPRDCDGNIISFLVTSSPKEVEEWLEVLGADPPQQIQQQESRPALQCKQNERRSSLRKSSQGDISLMPTLQEEEGAES